MFTQFVSRFAVFSLVFHCCFGLQGQTTRQNSPYSRFGIGDLYTADFTAAQGNGGLSATYTSSFYLNAVNPAALGWTKYTAFEVGGFFRTANMKEKSTGLSSRSNDGNFAYFGLGFPINRSKVTSIESATEADSTDKRVPIHWGMAISLMPHSAVGYNIQVRDTLANVGAVLNGYEGKGTHYQLQWANGFRRKNLSVGFSMGYFFGRSNRTSRIFLLENPLNTEAYFSNFRENENYNGFIWNLGVRGEWTFEKRKDNETDFQYRKRLKRMLQHKVAIGAYGNAGAKLSLRSNTQYDRYNPSLGYDTLFTTTDTSLNRKLPATVGVGISFFKEHTWMVGTNFEWNRWSTFSANSADAFRASLGGEWRPDSTSQEKYMKSICYRAGVFYSTDPRTIVSENGTTLRLRKIGGTIGFEFPIYARDKENRSRVTPSYLNVALEAGKFGNPDLIDEFYFRVSFGFTLNDASWFNKSKFR